jgi:type VI secretion system protein VasG
VGKTALVEGVAQKIVCGEVPDSLKACEIYSVDLCKLQAGASVKGEFEKRLQSLLNEASQQPHPVILFIDEAHMLLGAGGTAGQNDAANQLKPALSRSEFQVIGATTWAEYKAVFEKDAALARRFQLLKVAAPDENTAIAILRHAAPLLEKHHGVTILHEAVEAAVHLSERYMTDRQLPDKCLSLLDTACARVSLSQQYTPLVLEKAGAEVSQRQIHHAWLEREGSCRSKLSQLKRLHTEAEEHHRFLKNVWQSQKEQVLAGVPAGEAAALSAAEEAGYAGQSPMVYARVDATCVADVLSEWTGIPLGQVLTAQANDEKSLLASLTDSVIGQQEALTVLASKIFIARAGLHAPDKPVGVFMLAGPSGTGKTETALTLAAVYGVGPESLITINMSEYQEAHTVSSLKGAPPGYVGHGKGGILTEAVRKNPHSVILLDEIEKAHPDVLEMFYQVLDKGWLKDAEGITINFRNTLIVMTSNYASEQITQLNMQGVTDSDTLISTLRPLFDQHFKPAFMGRVQLLAYQPLSQASLLKIAQIKLDKIAHRVALNREGNFKLVIKPTALKAIVNACVVAQSGARDLDAMLETLILPGIARTLQLHKKQQGTITVSFSKKSFTFIWAAEEGNDEA